MIIFIAAAPGSASQTFKERLLRSKFFFNKKRTFDFKKGRGIGHFSVDYSFRIFLYFKILNFFNLNLLFYQHLLPNKTNIKKINKIFNNNIFYYLITRNIYDTAKHIKKLILLKKKLPFYNSTSKNPDFFFVMKNIFEFYYNWSKFIKKNNNSVKIITFNKIILHKNSVNDIEKQLKKKINIDKNIVLNKFKKINIQLTKKEKNFIDKKLLKINKKNIKLFKLI